MAEGTRPRRGRRILLACVIAFLAGLAGVELVFRWMLFNGHGAEGPGAKLRHAAYYADPASDDDFWKLFYRLDGLQPPVPDEAYHPELGWVSADIDSKTLRHVAAGQLRGRRPVLLYGDSFARCMGKRADCFEVLLALTEWNDRCFLLNHGVQGYGLDQVHLLVERTVDAYLAEKPVVVIGIQVDDALDRTILAMRGWPKPRFTLRDDELVPEFSPVPRMDDYLRDHPVTFPSYVWRYLQFGTRRVPRSWRDWLRGEDRIRERKRTISRHLLAAIHEGLERRGVEHFFLLFYGEDFVDGSRPPDWREALLLDWFRENAVPYTSARRAILEDAARSGRKVADYYDHVDEHARGHLLPAGNRAALQALIAGLEGRFETP